MPRYIFLISGSSNFKKLEFKNINRHKNTIRTVKFFASWCFSYLLFISAIISPKFFLWSEIARKRQLGKKRSTLFRYHQTSPQPKALRPLPKLSASKK